MEGVGQKERRAGPGGTARGRRELFQEGNISKSALNNYLDQRMAKAHLYWRLRSGSEVVAELDICRLLITAVGEALLQFVPPVSRTATKELHTHSPE